MGLEHLPNEILKLVLLLIEEGTPSPLEPSLDENRKADEWLEEWLRGEDRPLNPMLRAVIWQRCRAVHCFLQAGALYGTAPEKGAWGNERLRAVLVVESPILVAQLKQVDQERN